MRKFLLLVFLIMIFSAVSRAQQPSVVLVHVHGVPATSCSGDQLFKNDLTGDLYDCLSGTPHLIGALSNSAPGSFSNSASSFTNETTVAGCDPGSLFQQVQGAQFLTAAAAWCVNGPTNNPGSSYNQTAGSFSGATAAGLGSGSGSSRAVGASDYAIVTGNNTEAYGANLVAQDVNDLATGQQLIGTEIDVQPQKAASSYLGSGANVVGLHIALYNQAGQGGIYGSAIVADTHSFGTHAYFANFFDANLGMLCSTCPVFNVNPVALATSGANSTAPPIYNYYVGYWNGSGNAYDQWVEQGFVGSGTNPNLDWMLVSHPTGLGGQTHIYGFDNNINLGLRHSDGTWDEIVPSSATGASFKYTLPGLANGTIMVGADNLSELASNVTALTNLFTGITGCSTANTLYVPQAGQCKSVASLGAVTLSGTTMVAASANTNLATAASNTVVTSDGAGNLNGTTTLPNVVPCLTTTTPTNNVSTGATNFTAPCGTTTWSSTESQKTVAFPRSGTISNLYVCTNNTQTGGTAVYTVRLGAGWPSTGMANTALTVTIGSGAAAGCVQDSTHAFAYTAGLPVDIQLVNNGSGNAAVPAVIYAEFTGAH